MNREFLDILDLVGLDPSSVPAGRPHVASRQMDVLRKYVGFRAGLEAARDFGIEHAPDMDAPRIMGDFIERHLTFPVRGADDRSLYHSMRRQLALIEGATGYPMTSERSDAKARLYFWQAVLHEIKRRNAATPVVDAPNAAFASPTLSLS